MKILYLMILLIQIQQSVQKCIFEYDYFKGNNVICSKLGMSNVYSVILDIELATYHPSYDIRESFFTFRIEDSQLPILPNNFVGDHEKKIKKLYLNGNRIEILGNFSLFRISNLEEIHLENNLLVDIGRNMFDELQFLEVLDLSKNKIVNLHEDLFVFNPYLKELYISYNSLTTIPFNLLRSQSELKLLDISRNKITHINASLFSELANLTRLSLSFNNLHELPTDLFSCTPLITYLDVAYNPTENLKEEIFTNLKHLQVLNVSFTENNSNYNLSKWQNVSFTKISLKGKNITTLKFLGNKTLHFLNLARNKLRHIDGKILQYYHEDLKYLNLSYNLVEDLKENLFANFAKLEILDLRNNRLLSLQQTLFKNLCNLKYLDISKNLINSSLFSNNFRFLNKLQFLDLSGNKISYISTNHIDHAFSNFTNLQHLNLSNNQIKEVNPILFQNLTKLVKLDLHNNTLKHLAPNVFLNLENLELLDLSYNPIKVVRYGTFDKLQKLKILNLYQTGVALEQYITYSLNNLEELQINLPKYIVLRFTALKLNKQLRRIYVTPKKEDSCFDLASMTSYLKSLNISVKTHDENTLEDNVNGIPCRMTPWKIK